MLAAGRKRKSLFHSHRYHRIASMAESFQVTVGVHDEYEWLASEHCLDDLLKLCPEIVLGKYIAVTSVDSGHYFPTAKELAAGWESRSGIAYRPRVEKVETLPREGWDEWYVFDDLVDLGGMAARESNPFEASLSPGEVYAFVNYNNLGLHLPDERGIAPYFWKQFAWIRPRPYISESGDYLVVISSDRKLFATAREALKALDSSCDR
jgi:hypothetical protein